MERGRGKALPYSGVNGRRGGLWPPEGRRKAVGTVIGRLTAAQAVVAAGGGNDARRPEGPMTSQGAAVRVP